MIFFKHFHGFLRTACAIKEKLILEAGEPIVHVVVESLYSGKFLRINKKKLALYTARENLSNLDFILLN